MRLSGIPFGVTEWSNVERTERPGDSGIAVWRTRQFGEVRVRMVEYSPGYVADHWCAKGHILLCLAGELNTELEDGRRFTLKPGTSYQGRGRCRAPSVRHRERCDAVHRRLIVRGAAMGESEACRCPGSACSCWG